MGVRSSVQLALSGIDENDFHEQQCEFFISDAKTIRFSLFPHSSLPLSLSISCNCKNFDRTLSLAISLLLVFHFLEMA